METTAKYNAQPIYTENNVPVYPNHIDARSFFHAVT